MEKIQKLHKWLLCLISKQSGKNSNNEELIDKAINAFSFCPIKPGLRTPQLQVEWSVKLVYSIVVQRRC